jgi:hypothetical protein
VSVCGCIRLISSEKFKYSVCSIVALIGAGILATTCFFTMRSVNRLYLLKVRERYAQVRRDACG